MTVVRPKKNLGQHFLTDMGIAQRIVGSLRIKPANLLEVGPGTGVLTQYLFPDKEFNVKVIDVDRESIEYLLEKYPGNKEQIIYADFLKTDIAGLFDGESFSIVGNFPYNISSQIFFKVLDYRRLIPEVVGMLQKEVAERIAAPPGSKTYGILSVLLQAYYDIEYLFTVHENVFKPPPKVKSAVIRLKRNAVSDLGCNEVLFRQLVKSGFNQRRKMLRNSIKSFLPDGFENALLTQRPEQLSVKEFVELTNAIENS